MSVHRSRGEGDCTGQVKVRFVTNDLSEASTSFLYVPENNPGTIYFLGIRACYNRCFSGLGATGSFRPGKPGFQKVNSVSKPGISRFSEREDLAFISPPFEVPMIRIAFKFDFEFIPTPAFTRLAGLMILVLQWIGFL